MTTELMLLFYCLLFAVAFLYASVGHGGASGYLALMAIFSIAPAVMKPTALMLNLFVSLTSFIQFYRGKHFKWQIFLPFALASIPMAYLGGLIHINGEIYKKILGLLLLIPVIRFWFFSKVDVTELKNILASALLVASIKLIFTSTEVKPKETKTDSPASVSHN